MIKYFINATEQIALLSLLLGFIYAYGVAIYESTSKRFFQTATGLGVLFTCIMTYLKINTSKIDTSLWNIRIFTVSLVFTVLFVVFTIVKNTTKWKKVGSMGALTSLSAYLCLLILYYGTPLLEIPHTIALSEDAIVSSAYLIKFLGFVFAIILAWVMGTTAYKGSLTQGKKASLVYLAILLFINTLKYAGTEIGLLITKRMITSTHTLFLIAKYTNNYSQWFIYAGLATLIVLAIIVIVQSVTEKEPYTNPAEKRKIIAKWRRRKRTAITSLVCILLTVLTMTVLSYYANKEVELSPIESSVVENGNVYVSLDQVNDGALHRFGYEAEDGTVIRFIVIQKTSGISYGVGLDACDICGETGYYEKNGQVVCNLCDVVMNINTIGFKGGCNPIIIDWSIENGYIVVPIEGLLEHISEFQ